jgi:hypothetical protein
VRADPRAALVRLCGLLGLPFKDSMLTWPGGPKPYDGIWAPHWYNAVHASTGFDEPEAALPALSDDNRRLSDQALPAYEHLARFAI